MVFWLVVSLMLGLGLAVLLFVLRKPVNALADSREENLLLAREKLAELDAELAAETVDQATYQQAKEEIEQGLLDDTAGTDQPPTVSRGGKGAATIALLALVPLLSVGLYLQLGSPQHLQMAGPGAATQNPHAEGASGSAPTMAELLTGLEQRVEQNPKDPEAWFMLGKVYAGMERFGDAVKAYEELAGLTNNHPQALIALADALAMSQGGSMNGRPYELVRQALDQEPDDATALWLAGKGAWEAEDYQNAIYYWRQAEAGLADQPEYVQELRGLIARAKSEAKKSGLTVDDPGSAVQLGAPAGIELQVSLAPQLNEQASPGDPLFIFAKAVNGPPMPLAAIRLTAGELPKRIVLNDSHLLQGGKLSDHKQLKIGARIARSGQPMAASGDLQSAEVVVDPAAGKPVELLIDQQVP